MTANADKIALVTGGNKGIGLALVRALAQAGVRVILSARDEQRGRQAKEALLADGLTVDFVPLDVTRPESIRAAAQTVAKHYERLDILVNNAGILPDANLSALTIAPDMVRAVLETNTLGPFQVLQAFAPLLQKSDGGKVANISSGLGALHDMENGYTAYSLSKAALNAVTRIFAAELRPFNVSVNSICPGWVRTDMGGSNAERSPEQSAAGILPVLLSDTLDPTGQFLRDGQPIAW